MQVSARLSQVRVRGRYVIERFYSRDSRNAFEIAWTLAWTQQQTWGASINKSYARSVSFDTVIAGSETSGPEIAQIHGVMTFVVPPSGTVRDGLSLW